MPQPIRDVLIRGLGRLGGEIIGIARYDRLDATAAEVARRLWIDITRPPAAAQRLIHASSDLYARLERLDQGQLDDALAAAPGPPAMPASEDSRTRLARARVSAPSSAMGGRTTVRSSAATCRTT